MKSRGLS
jgi:hypothetical protein